MKTNHNSRAAEICGRIDGRLAAYLTAAGAVGSVMASEAHAVIVKNLTPQAWGINGVVNIDFNSDGQTDFQLDHDQVDLSAQSGPVVDYLQIDKNDVNGASLGENLLAFDPITNNQAMTFPPNATVPNDANESAYVINGLQGSYPAALTSGSLIGPASTFDYQEGDNFQSGGKDIRANRLIDEDKTQIDQLLGGQPPSGVQLPFGNPGGNFLGIGSNVRYLGVKMDLNNADGDGNGPFTYGWIGIKITDPDQALGEVVGWGYETSGAAIRAGEIPEPGAILLSLIGGATIAGCFLWRQLFRR